MDKLKEYINMEREKGFSDEVISQTLLSHGYSPELVHSYMQLPVHKEKDNRKMWVIIAAAVFVIIIIVGIFHYLNNSEKAQIHLNRCERLLSVYELEHAEEECLTSLEYKANRHAYLILGWIYLEQGQYEKAKTMSEKGSAMGEATPFSRRLQAKILYDQGDYAKAEKHLQMTISVNPTPELYRDLANVQIELGKYEEAIRNLKLVDPQEDPYILYVYSKYYYRKGDNENATVFLERFQKVKKPFIPIGSQSPKEEFGRGS